MPAYSAFKSRPGRKLRPFFMAFWADSSPLYTGIVSKNGRRPQLFPAPVLKNIGKVAKSFAVLFFEICGFIIKRKRGMEGAMAAGNLRSTKDEVLEYVAQATQRLDGKDMARYTAQDIGYQLSISRNLASQYLNELAAQGLVVKVVTRPVYFIHRRTAERKYGCKLPQESFKSVEELMDTLEGRAEEKPDFGKAVGSEASLNYCIEQCKAAMQYPPNGLPLLISGAAGTGKSFFAQLTYEYARRSGCIPAQGRLVTVRCSEFAQGGRALFEALFGGQTGLVAQCAGGILLFDMVQLLPGPLQKELFSYFDSFTLQQQALAVEQRVPVCRLMFTAESRPFCALDKSFLRRIPIQAELPELEERSTEEKTQLILHFLHKEELRMGMQVAVSPQALAALADFRYAENISQLYNDIRITCANAFLAREGGAGPLALKLYHMPEELLSGYHADTQAMEDTGSLMTLEQVRGTLRTRPAQAYYEGLLDGFRAFANGQSSFDAMLASWAQTLYAYDEYLVFGRKYDNSKVRAIGQVVEQVLAHVLEQHGIQFPADSAAMITRGVYDMMKEQVWVARWEQANAGELQQCAAAVQGSMPQVYAIAQSVDALLSRNLNMAQEGCVRLVFLAAYIHEMDPGLHVPDTVGIIVSHGTSTASSMAHTVNQLLKSPVFTPFDMPLSSSEDEIVCRIRHFLHLRRFVRNLVVLVDMGSLEDVGLGLQGIGNIDIGILNNTSTRLALDAGAAILEGVPMEQLLKCACERSASHYRTIINRRRKDAILFACEAGGNAARRMMQMFRESLPRAVDVDIMTFDFSALVKGGAPDDVFREYNILFISGLFDPGWKDVPFIPVEDIIDIMENPTVYRAFARYLSRREMEAFQQNLLKNFSLENAVKSLTILDADRLLDFVESALKRLQSALGRPFGAKTLLGLYIHISCMVERLVTKTFITSFEGQAEFEREHEAFIRAAHSAFAPMCEHYHVELPASELGYIYDYIERDSSPEAGQTDDF